MIVASAGPDWASIMTAFGTVGAVVVALGIAVWSERRTDRRLSAEREHSDKQLADERAFSRAQVAEERQIARDREQLTEAYAVQVVTGEMDTEDCPVDEFGDSDGSVKQLAVMVINRGRYTITRVEAQFCLSGTNLITHNRSERLPGFRAMPEVLRAGWGQPLRDTAMLGVLTPWDTGMRFSTDAIHVRHLGSPYPIVRWTDQWGTRWEHNRGRVRQIDDGEEWVP